MKQPIFTILGCMILLLTSVPIQSMPISSTPLIIKNTTAMVLTTDYIESSLATIDVSEPSTLETDLVTTQGDDEIKYYNGHVYILNRMGHDRIDVFDVNDNYAYVRNISTGPGTNPYDIAFLSLEKAYVTLYDSTELLIVNPSTGEHLGTIDFSEYADADGIPEMHKMVAFSILGMKRVYVTIQRLNRSQFFAPTEESYLLELDGDKDEIIRSITLTGVNPTTAPIKRGKYIYVGETGSWMNATDGGIERVHLFTNEAEGFVFTEEELGGNLVDFDFYPKFNGVVDTFLSFAEQFFGFTFPINYGFALISDIGFNTALVSFDEATEEITTLTTSEGWQLVDLACSKQGDVVVADRTFEAEGVHIFHAKTREEITSEPLAVGSLPPIHVTFLE